MDKHPSKAEAAGERRLLRIGAVLQRVGVGRTTLYAWVKNGTFPAPIRLSPRCTVWNSRDVDAWIEARVAEADEGR